MKSDDENECPSCNGYGLFDAKGNTTVDRSVLGRGGRKCLDCRGTGQRGPVVGTSCECGGDVLFVTDQDERRIYFSCPKCKAAWDAPVVTIVTANRLAAWKRGAKALESGVTEVRLDDSCGRAHVLTTDGSCVEVEIKTVAVPAELDEMPFLGGTDSGKKERTKGSRSKPLPPLSRGPSPTTKRDARGKKRAT